MDCEHEYTICNSLIQTNEQDKYTCELCTGSKQTERVVSRSNQILRPIDIEDNVTIPISSFDRGRDDPRNIIMYRNTF